MHQDGSGGDHQETNIGEFPQHIDCKKVVESVDNGGISHTKCKPPWLQHMATAAFCMPSNVKTVHLRINCYLLQIWGPYCLRCWWAIGNEWYLASCMWWRRQPIKPSYGTNLLIQQPSHHKVSIQVITWICNHHNVQKRWCDFLFCMQLRHACMTWQHHRPMKHKRINNNIAWWWHGIFHLIG